MTPNVNVEMLMHAVRASELDAVVQVRKASSHFHLLEFNPNQSMIDTCSSRSYKLNTYKLNK